MVGRGDRQQAIHSFSFDSSHKPPVVVGSPKRTKSREGLGLHTANNKTERDYHENTAHLSSVKIQSSERNRPAVVIGALH